MICFRKIQTNGNGNNYDDSKSYAGYQSESYESSATLYDNVYDPEVKLKSSKQPNNSSSRNVYLNIPESSDEDDGENKSSIDSEDDSDSDSESDEESKDGNEKHETNSDRSCMKFMEINTEVKDMWNGNIARDLRKSIIKKLFSK